MSTSPAKQATKKNIGALFDSIAASYDSFNHLLSLNIDRKWRRKAVRMIKPAGELLDVAVGTGDLAMEIAVQNKAVHITGIDISNGMMDIGRKKVEDAGLGGRISFREESALDMTFPEGSFDAVTCAYGVRNFSDLDKGLSEMYRVLKPGSEMMILEFSYPSNRIIRYLYDFFFCNVMPVVGKLLSRNKGAYTYFRDSVKGFIWGGEMADRISSAGFSNVRFKTFTFGITTVYLAEK